MRACLPSSFFLHLAKPIQATGQDLSLRTLHYLHSSNMPSVRPYSAAEHLAAMPSLAIPALFSVEGKVCFVSGGSRGIGLMIAKGSYCSELYRLHRRR